MESIGTFILVGILILPAMLLLASFLQSRITCKYCGEKMSKKAYETHFCAEKYKEYAKEAAKTTGGYLHSVRYFRNGKWGEV